MERRRLKLDGVEKPYRIRLNNDIKENSELHLTYRKYSRPAVWKKTADKAIGLVVAAMVLPVREVGVKDTNPKDNGHYYDIDNDKSIV